MRFVNCARFESEQNLDAVEVDGEVFYFTYKRVMAGKELLVWYGDNCAKTLGINIGSPGKQLADNMQPAQRRFSGKRESLRAGYSDNISNRPV